MCLHIDVANEILSASNCQPLDIASDEVFHNVSIMTHITLFFCHMSKFLRVVSQIIILKSLFTNTGESTSGKTNDNRGRSATTYTYEDGRFIEGGILNAEDSEAM
jgi:hypothetical protein